MRTPGLTNFTAALILLTAATQMQAQSADSELTQNISVAGWRAAIPIMPPEPAEAVDARNLADRGFNPTDLEFELLNLAVVTRPMEHELGLAKEVPPSAAPTQIALAVTGPVPSLLEPESVSVGADPAAEIEPEQNWKPLRFGRPVLRQGAREVPKPLEFGRPELRPGSRDPYTGTEDGEELSSSAETDALIEQTIADILDEEPQSTDLLRPKKRPPTEDVTDVDAAPDLPEGLDLSETNLIGVYGEPDFLRALVRLPNGEFLNLYAGGDFDGGQVVEITGNSLTYEKGGNLHQLQLPR
ncbi:MAG: hypothetical protein OXF74_02725 [Rhodobacteraceae bacterium]|nr:hypothetical protein [Paracoccaceae bacterium]